MSEPVIDPLPANSDSEAVALPAIGAILGLVGVCFAPIGLIGVILTSIAVWREGKARGQVSKMTVAALSIALIGLLFGSFGFMMTLGQARSSSRSIAAQQQLKEINAALQTYSRSYKGQLPPIGSDWKQLLIDHGGAKPKSFDSPYARGNESMYVYVPPGVPISELKEPGRTLLVFEDTTKMQFRSVWGLMADGYVARLDSLELWKLAEGRRTVDGAEYRKSSNAP